MKVLVGFISVGVFLVLAGVGVVLFLSAVPVEPPASHESAYEGRYKGWASEGPHFARLPWIRNVDRPAPVALPRADIPWVRDVSRGPAVHVALANCPWMRNVDRPAVVVVPAAQVPWTTKAATRP